MIKVLLTGGLGNQMFQYAFGRTLSAKYNTDMVLSTAFLDSKLPIKNLATQLKFELEIFNIKASTEQNKISSNIFYPLAKTEYLLRNIINSIQLNLLEEHQHHFNPEYLEIKNNSYIKGNYQSEKYFSSISSIIKSDFEFINNLDAQNLQTKSLIDSSNAISLHIRRGDYISLKQNVNKFSQIPISYYQTAIKFIAAKIEKPVFFVFSDDIDWVKDNLKIEFPLLFINNNNSPDTSYIDMQLMSFCKHNIICNSTFSWWAAWLNNNPHKIVVAPNIWFSDLSINSQDILPIDWIKL